MSESGEFLGTGFLEPGMRCRKLGPVMAGMAHELSGAGGQCFDDMDKVCGAVIAGEDEASEVVRSVFDETIEGRLGEAHGSGGEALVEGHGTPGEGQVEGAADKRYTELTGDLNDSVEHGRQQVSVLVGV